jgi:hypothetical protein
VNGGHRGAALLAAVLGLSALAGAVLAPPSAGAALTPLQPRIALPHAVPSIPSDAARLGSAPGDAMLHLDVVLAGQDPAGLSAAVAAVSTPGSSDYRRYLTAAEYAAAYGPSPAEVAQVSAALQSEGLSVGMPDAGSNLLPVSGTASVVSAAFGTPLEQVQAPNEARAIVNTASPQIPSSLAGAVTGVVGLDGLFREHSMLVRGPGSPSVVQGAGPSQGQAVEAHAGVPQACPAAAAEASGGIYTSTQLASVFGLDQMFGQGRTGIGQTIAVVEFEQYLQSDFAAFESCYGLSNPIRNELVDGGPPGPPQGVGEAALDTELAAFNAPSASLVVYEAPNGNDAQAFDLFNQIASDDSAKVVTTSWGICEAAMPQSDRETESQIFARMALQGQTLVAASGDTGSEDCFSAPQFSGTSEATTLAVDDPGSQPDAVSVGGTALPSLSAASQVVWNDCQGAAQPACREDSFNGAGGGGYSIERPANPGQPTSGPDPCGLGSSGCRSVPDIVYPAKPSAGGEVDYYDGAWVAFGGTSVGAPATAGFFADTDQGCFASLGRVGPSLYAAAGTSNFTAITSGNNDFTGTNGGDYHAGTGSSGLGSPVDQNLSVALQGADGCPSVAAVSPNTGPISGSGAITISGGGLANAATVSFGAAGDGQIVSRSETSLTVIPPSSDGSRCVDITVTNSQGVSATSPADHYGFGGDLNCGQGYRFVASDGGIFDYGDATFWGSTGGLHLDAPVVGMAVTPSTNGYWLVAADGGIFAFGDAQFYGSMGGKPLNQPIVGMAATPNGGGYWEVAADGGIFAFGDAQFYGSMGGKPLNQPIVGMAATPNGGGYWEVAADGGIFAFGEAQFYGSAGDLVLNSPVVGMAAGPGGGGYWLVAADGGIFNYGDAGFFGSAGGMRLNKAVVGMAATPDGGGYWLVAADGGIFNYGDAGFFGSAGDLALNAPIVGMSSA